MSNATCASPVATSQLFFAWSEQAVAPQPASPAPTGYTAPAGYTAISPSTTVPQRAASLAQTGRLDFNRDARIAKPVRMGAVMIKLLKRYGITDQEIAEGVANYARKHQKALAS